MHDAAFIAGAHRRQHPVGEFLRAEQIGLELQAQRLAREVFDRARLTIGTVVDERVEPAAGARQHFIHRGADRIRRAQVEHQAFKPGVAQRGDIFLLPYAGENAVAARMQTEGQAAADAAGTAGDEDGFLVYGDVRLV